MHLFKKVYKKYFTKNCHFEFNLKFRTTHFWTFLKFCNYTYLKVLKANIPVSSLIFLFSRMPPQTMKFKENPERDADKEYQCHLCQRKCSSSQNLKGHVIKYHQEHYNCPKCFKSFPLDESENFRLHLFKHEYLLTPRPNKCITCGKVFKINKILQIGLVASCQKVDKIFEKNCF